VPIHQYPLLNSLPSPPQPAGCVTATPLLLLLFENLLRHFQNTDSVGTEPKEAAYAITGENADNSPRKIINIELSDFGRIIDNSEVILIIHHSPLPIHHCPFTIALKAPDHVHGYPKDCNERYALR
jgi:hypothetical protein